MGASTLVTLDDILRVEEDAEGTLFCVTDVQGAMVEVTGMWRGGMLCRM